MNDVSDDVEEPTILNGEPTNPTKEKVLVLEIPNETLVKEAPIENTKQLANEITIKTIEAAQKKKENELNVFPFDSSDYRGRLFESNDGRLKRRLFNW